MIIRPRIAQALPNLGVTPQQVEREIQIAGHRQLRGLTDTWWGPWLLIGGIVGTVLLTAVILLPPRRY